MNKKTTGIVAYITWIGLLVAYLAGDKEGAKFHINQALVITIASLISTVFGMIPVIGWLFGWIISLFVFICAIMGLVYAIKEEEKEVPLLGKIKILK